MEPQNSGEGKWAAEREEKSIHRKPCALLQQNSDVLKPNCRKQLLGISNLKFKI